MRVARFLAPGASTPSAGLIDENDNVAEVAGALGVAHQARDPETRAPLQLVHRWRQNEDRRGLRHQAANLLCALPVDLED